MKKHLNILDTILSEHLINKTFVDMITRFH